MENQFNTGIWIDTKNAIIVKLHNDMQSIEKVESEIETRERFEGEGKQSMRMGDQYSTDEKTKEERMKHQLKDYFEKVIDQVKDADAIHVFGPAEAKIGLKKEFEKHPHLIAKLKKVEAADSMTENQVVELIKNSF